MKKLHKVLEQMLISLQKNLRRRKNFK